MATKIFVSQIDSTNPDGSSASSNSFIVLNNGSASWVSANQIFGEAPTGYQGSAGFQGSAGATGADGAAGATGYQGSAGEIGYTGSPGDAGPDGERGLEGYRGSQGVVGFYGSAGEPGPTGFTGSRGEEGEPGYAGSAGDVGFTGSVGDRGATGYTGSEGYFGSTGYSGSLGDTGFKGSVGFTGSVGDQGPEGYRGSLGEVGYTGSAGPDGSAGLIEFVQLTDVPQSYTGEAGKFVKVNAGEDGLEFEANTVVLNPLVENLDAAGFVISNPILAGYGELVTTVDGSTDPTLDPAQGNVYKVNLDAPVSTITISNGSLNADRLYYVTLILQQDATGSRTVDWSNQTIYWPSSENISSPAGPALSTTANYTDVVTLYTYNQGTYWVGVLSAKGFPTT